MSIDISVKVVRPIYEEVGNITSNVSPMFAEALGFGIGKLNHQPTAAAADQIQRAIDAMEADPDKYRALQPEKWGSYPGALDFLRKFLAVCNENPDGIVRITM